MKTIAVIGGGITGVTTAYALAKRGFAVTLFERHRYAAMETSFANGGQISVSHAEPWANPHAPAKILRWLTREDAPLLFRLRADWQQWLWGLSFLLECTPARTRHNIRQLVNLGLYSRAALQELRLDTAIEYDQLTRGILHFYTSSREFDNAQEPARLMREFGCELEMKSAAQCVAIEPALAAAAHLIAGGSLTPSDESGDAHKFTQNLGRLTQARGTRFEYGCSIEALESAAGRVTGVRVAQAGAPRRFAADAYVLCLGAYSPRLVRALRRNQANSRGLPMELGGLEPPTSWVRSRRSPN